jgi:hypothetical protein
VREEYLVDLFTPDPFEVAALIISRWAWPGVNEAVGRDRLYLSLCSWFIRDHAARDPAWAEQPQWIRPDQACRADADIKRDRRTLDTRLKDRVTAGRISIAFLQEAETGMVPELPPGVARLSVNELAGYAQRELGVADVANMKTRVWRPSRSVIHLCAAWVVIAQEHFNEHGTRLVLDQVMRRPEFLALLIHRAQLYEPLVDQSRMRISADELIKFRLVRGGVITNSVS